MLFRNTILNLERERDETKKAFDKEHKVTEEIMRDRDGLRKDLKKADGINFIILCYDKKKKSLSN